MQLSEDLQRLVLPIYGIIKQFLGDILNSYGLNLYERLSWKEDLNARGAY